MTSHDDEVDEFLRKRRPLFGRDEDLEPPLELDRVVLRRAREAIEGERRPHRMFRAPSWGMPVALAATLVLAFTIILRVGPSPAEKKAEVTVQQVSRQIEIPAAPPPAAAPSIARPSADAAPLAETPAVAANDNGPVLVDLGAAHEDARAASARKPEYRRDSKTWLAEIERLRAAGDGARADAELDEYKREHRAYAGAPDR